MFVTYFDDSLLNAHLRTSLFEINKNIYLENPVDTWLLDFVSDGDDRSSSLALDLPALLFHFFTWYLSSNYFN